jgi:hypothetical protein
VDIKTPTRSPLALHFESPVEAAGILDPEADRTVRANLEWGEHPQLTTEQVGEVTLSDDHQDVVFYPTRLAAGQTLYVTCAAECPAGSVIAASGESVPLVAGPIGVGAWALNGNPGTVIVVGRSEADALLAAPTDASQLEALKVLGYIDPD